MVAGARTAVRPVDGELAGWNPVVLAGAVGRETLERARLDAGVLDEVVVGCCDPVGAAGADAARAIVLAAGWPVSIGGLVVDRGETSGAAAVQAAVAAIRAGQARTVLVIGLGLCSVVPPGAAALNRTYGAPWGGVAERFEEVGGLLPAPRLSERAAQAAGIGRAEIDAAAEESRRRRRAAAGTSPAVVAVAARPGSAAGRGVYRGDPVAADIARDWGDTAALPPSFDDDGLLTAATFAPPADAVAAVLLQAGAHEAGSIGERHGETAAVLTGEALRPAAPLATVAGMGRAAGDPFDPVGNVAAAVGRALAEAEVELDAVDDIAVVEHDAATATLVGRALGVDGARINRSGGAVATGNAGAAEELRLITDGLAAPAGHRLLTISAGPTGSAAIVWQTDI
jgi:acetyl-CoA acetyltransferase